MQHIWSRTPFLAKRSGELPLYTVFNIEVKQGETLHKQGKYLAGKKPCLILNLIFVRPEAATIVDKTIKRSGGYIGLWYLNSNLWAGRHLSLVA